jgi:predicted membrane-bound dolichyl-phosphate-mannose-protein mannosyltransferase
MVSWFRGFSRRHPWLPLALLAVVCVLSLAARAGGLGDPCTAPCTTANDHALEFDEAYYINAARVIVGLMPPAGDHYAGAPSGKDPNAEHPQLAKLIIAGSIEAFGDGPFAWRLGSLIFGTLAILGMYALARAAGGGPWLALAAATMMAADNLQIVHGRIGTLDVYVLAAMVWSAVLYMRDRPLGAGVVLGIGSCFKLVAPYLLLTYALLEVFRWLVARRDAIGGLKRFGVCLAAGTVVFFALLEVLGLIAPPYDPVAGKAVGGGAFGHFSHMVSYAAAQTSPHGPTGIASYPWQWLLDLKPITYLAINPVNPPGGVFSFHASTHFLGMISPPIIALAIPALAVGVLTRSGRGGVGLLALAWFLGTWVPFELQSLIWSRTSYLYYMVIVMPGIYLAVAQLFATLRLPWWLVALWWVAVFIAAAVMFPFTPWPNW